MSERTEFLCKYAERRLGRALTESEKGQIADLTKTSRRSVSDLCAEWAKVKKPAAKKSKSVVKDKDIEAVVKEETKDEE